MLFVWGLLAGVVLSIGAAVWAYSNDSAWFRVNKALAWINGRVFNR